MMKKSLLGWVFFLSLLLSFPAERVHAAYDMGTKEMATGAGVAAVEKPARAKTVNLTAPATLNQSDTEYVLQNDIIANGTAFTIQGSNITLNLNGHTIVYLNRNASQAYGVYIDGASRSNIAIVNGKITQGNGSCSGQSGVGKNCNPIYAFETFGIEIGGLEISYRADNTHGVFLHWGKAAHIHHTSVQDSGTVVTDRHQGIDAIRAGNLSGSRVHHTTVKTRQVGIRVGTGSEINNNEVTINSQVTNSVGLSIQSGSVHHNKVYGSGVHPIGIWPDHDAKVYSNYVESQSTRSGAEYGDTGSACLRMTWGTGNNSEIMYNTFIVNASANYNGTGFNSWGRALFVGLPEASLKADIHDNVIIATNNDGKGKAAGIAVVTNNVSSGLVFRNNRVESNWANVLLADDYGYADGYAKFIDNTFVKRDNYSSYKTVRSEYSSRPSTGVFTGNTMENGASLENVDLEFSGTGKKDILVYWHLGVAVKNSGGAVLSGSAVSVKDSTGKVVYSGQTDANGSITADVLQFEDSNLSGGSVVSREVKTVNTPHTITVSRDGLTATRSVTVNANMTVEMTLGAV
ncbi:MAG: carboxypeptidase-like regulatory domain-containing protein [Thermodesulfovibrionales bacterium]